MRSFCLSIILFSIWSLPILQAAEDEVRVLFVGNSYSFQVPKVFAKLAESKGKKVVVEQVTKGGWTLKKHAAAKVTQEKISGAKWDFVILQEQSQLPSFPDAQVKDLMGAAAKSLSDLAKKSGAKVLFFETWGRRDGDKKNRPDDTFEEMQKRLTKGYAAVAKSSGGTVVPVGKVWAKLKRDALWAKDGSHPSKMGSYVAACVIYTKLFEESPEGAKFVSGLDKELAKEIQIAAGEEEEK